jgi:ABC-type Fe3+/spermidine/putrescine transport system ATPase subunit
VIRVEALEARVGTFHLGPANLSVPAGSSFVLLGPTGAGKTLFLECLLGMHRPSGGRIVLDGADVTHAPPEDRAVAYLPQDLALFPHLSVRDNILFGPSIRRWPKKRWQGPFDALVERLQLAPLLGRRDVRTLSGGERQRVALARALVLRPKVLFLDEPFSSLDALARRSLQLSILDLQREAGLTFFLVTHDHEEAFIMADAMAVMLQGRIEQEGPPEAFTANPASLKVARFLLVQNLFPALFVRESEGLWFLEAGGVVVAAKPKPGLRPRPSMHIGIRPEALVVLRRDRPLAPWMTCNLLAGRVERILNLGNRRYARVSVDGSSSISLEVAVTQHLVQDLSLREGDAITLHVRPESVWVHWENGDPEGAP